MTENLVRERSTTSRDQEPREQLRDVLSVAPPSRPRVFVVHEPLKKIIDDSGRTSWARTRDLSPAAVFGEMIFVFPRGKLPLTSGYHMATARERMADFTGADYVLPSGDPVAIMACTLAAAARLGDDESNVRVLVWNGAARSYYETTLAAFPDDGGVDVDDDSEAEDEA